jgi:hypothetical protein
MNFEVNTINDQSFNLSLKKKQNSKDTKLYELIDTNQKVWLELKLNNNRFEILLKDEEIIDTDSNLESKLDSLLLKLIESEQSGTESTEAEEIENFDPFNPEDIKVHAKQFSLRLITDMIEEGDIDLSPDFQRNLVWTNFAKSRLIESILLRIPLPMFYFSEDEVGRITIVDGLQRLSAIQEFMENKFPLRKLEYLTDSCEGRYYESSGKKLGLDAKYVRWFNQTQFSVNVIDPSSPAKVKYDIFRRINTGGKPLNNQEIRNCLAGKSLRAVINKMVDSEEFKSATDNSIRSKRMEDQDVALRFILFQRFVDEFGNIDAYNGYMDSSLNILTEELSKSSEDELEVYVNKFSNAMKNAEYLFGNRYAFRKVTTYDIEPGAYKQLINKALFVCLTILLSEYNPAEIRKNNKEKSLLEPLAGFIENEMDLMDFLSYGTNNRANLIFVYGFLKDVLISDFLKT